MGDRARGDWPRGGRRDRRSESENKRENKNSHERGEAEGMESGGYEREIEQITKMNKRERESE